MQHAYWLHRNPHNAHVSLQWHISHSYAHQMIWSMTRLCHLSNKSWDWWRRPFYRLTKLDQYVLLDILSNCALSPPSIQLACRDTSHNPRETRYFYHGADIISPFDVLCCPFVPYFHFDRVYQFNVFSRWRLNIYLCGGTCQLCCSPYGRNNYKAMTMAILCLTHQPL